MAEMNSTLSARRLADAHPAPPPYWPDSSEEIDVLIRNRLRIWECWIAVESDAGISNQLLASGLTKEEAWRAGSDAMDARRDVIGWRRVRRMPSA